MTVTLFICLAGCQESSELMLTLDGLTDPVTSVCFSPDGARLASASRDRTLKVWDAITGQVILTLNGHANFVLSVSFSPDGTRLASASADRTVTLWDTTTGQETLTLKGHASMVSSVCFSPDAHDWPRQVLTGR